VVITDEIGRDHWDIRVFAFSRSDSAVHLSGAGECSSTFHVTLVPYIKAGGGIKGTKPPHPPTQKASPNCAKSEIVVATASLICRTEKPARFRGATNNFRLLLGSVSEKAVIEAVGRAHIYEVPRCYTGEGLDQLVVTLLHLKTPEPDPDGNWGDLSRG